jgi:hypothetical protein
MAMSGLCDMEISHPSHYTQGDIEVLDFIIDQNLSYCIGNVVKYCCRYKYKGSPVTDLKKAMQYLAREIMELERDG